MGRKGLGVKAPANCRLIGRWRIVEADLRDRAYLNLCGPATLTITAKGRIAFGVMAPDFLRSGAAKFPSLAGRRSTVWVIGASVFRRPAATFQGLLNGMGGGLRPEAGRLRQEVGDPRAADSLSLRSG